MADIETNKMSGDICDNAQRGLRALLAFKPILGIIPRSGVSPEGDETYAIILQEAPGEVRSLHISQDLANFAFSLVNGPREDSLPLTTAQPDLDLN